MCVRPRVGGSAVNLEARISELVRDAIEPMITAHLNDLEERLLERFDALVRPPEAPALLTQAEVARQLRVDPRTLQRMVAAGEFPPPIRISPGRSRWRQVVVDAWFEERES